MRHHAVISGVASSAGVSWLLLHVLLLRMEVGRCIGGVGGGSFDGG
jgi:hypothetical protein